MTRATSTIVDDPDEELEEGMRVVIKGLTTAPEYNGMHGVIESWLAAKEKWVVRLDKGEKKLTVLPEYLQQLQPQDLQPPQPAAAAASAAPQPAAAAAPAAQAVPKTAAAAPAAPQPPAAQAVPTTSKKDKKPNTSVLPVDAEGEAVNDEGVPETPKGSDAPAEPLKARIHRLVEEPESGRWARVMSGFIFVTIMISISCFLLETHPDLRGLDVWAALEVVSTLIFSIEYGVRFACCDAEGVAKSMTRAKFVKSPMNILDLLAILPWYLETILMGLVSDLGGLRVLRSVRLIRLFRILKLGKYSAGMYLIVAALRKALQALSILSFFLCIGVILFSSLMFFAEKISCPDVKQIIDKGEWNAYVADCDAGAAMGSIGWQKEGDKFCCDEYGSSLDFPSITATFWWAVVTMTTVGYGDQVPRTGLGRIVGCFAMICGILLISLPVAIVGSKFQEAYEEMEGSKAAEDEATKTEIMEAWEASKKAGAAKLQKLTSGVEKVRTSIRTSNALAGFMQAAAAKKSTEQTSGGPEAKKAVKKPRPGPFKSIPRLRTKLRELQEMPEVSDNARKQIRGIFTLFDQVDRIEREAQALKAPDMKLQATIRREFNALMKVCEGREGGLKKRNRSDVEPLSPR